MDDCKKKNDDILEQNFMKQSLKESIKMVEKEIQEAIIRQVEE